MTTPTNAGDPTVITDADLVLLRQCVQLADDALQAGDEPFGSLLTGADGTVLFTDHNRVSGGDQTRHPEFEVARWAAAHLTPAQRAESVVYTSGEHCPMCSAAHAWVGLGRIVYAVSSAQLTSWLTEWDQPQSPVAALPINAIAPAVPVAGPADALVDDVKALQARSRNLPV